MRIYLVRHGKTLGNKSGVYNGKKDEHVSEEGYTELNLVIPLYSGVIIDYLYCSTLTRTKQTALHLFKGKEIDNFYSEINELDFGDWTGTSIIDNLKRLESIGYTWNDFVDPDNGETYCSLFERSGSFIKKMREIHNDNDNIVIVSHGLVIAAIIYELGNKDVNFYKLVPDNGKGYYIDFNLDGHIIYSI